MKSSTARFFAGLAIILVIVAGIFTVYSVVAEETPITLASGTVKTIETKNVATAKITKSADIPLSYCERIKISQLDNNYDKTIFRSNDPNEICEADSDNIIHNYNKATFI